jgi:hypothetical protein
VLVLFAALEKRWADGDDVMLFQGMPLGSSLCEQWYHYVLLVLACGWCWQAALFPPGINMKPLAHSIGQICICAADLANMQVLAFGTVFLWWFETVHSLSV